MDFCRLSEAINLADSGSVFSPWRYGTACLKDETLLLPKALQVLRHLAGERQVFGIKAFDLFNARAGILGEVEDVDLAVGEDDAHADGGVTEAIDAALGSG